jgi:hypothetical protein
LLDSDATADGTDDGTDDGSLDFNGMDEGKLDGSLDLDGTADGTDNDSLDMVQQMTTLRARLTLMAQRMRLIPSSKSKWRAIFELWVYHSLANDGYGWVTTLAL